MEKAKNGNIIKTGDGKTVDDWVNNVWPTDAVKAITSTIHNWKNVVKLRASVNEPVVSKLSNTCQLVVNYNSEAKCFAVWNAAIQAHIHQGDKLRLSVGSKGKEIIHQNCAADSLISIYRPIGQGKSNYVELIWIVGTDAFVDFCKEYKKLIRPDPASIPKGKICLYAVAGGEIQYIPSKKED